MATIAPDVVGVAYQAGMCDQDGSWTDRSEASREARTNLGDSGPGRNVGPTYSVVVDFV